MTRTRSRSSYKVARQRILFWAESLRRQWFGFCEDGEIATMRSVRRTVYGVRCAVYGVRCVVVGFCEVGERWSKDDDGGTSQPNIGQGRTHHSNANLADVQSQDVQHICLSLFVAIHVAHAQKKKCCCMFPKFGCGGRSGESVDHILDLDRGELKDAVRLLNAGRGFVSRVVGGSHL